MDRYRPDQDGRCTAGRKSHRSQDRAGIGKHLFGERRPLDPRARGWVMLLVVGGCHRRNACGRCLAVTVIDPSDVESRQDDKRDARQTRRSEDGQLVNGSFTWAPCTQLEQEYKVTGCAM